METIVFATGNQDKLREIRMILGSGSAEILSMKDAGFLGEIAEDGTTFAENAIIKATAVMRWLTGREEVWPDLSGAEAFAGHLPDLSGAEASAGRLPDLSGAEAFAGHLPDLGRTGASQGQTPMPHAAEHWAGAPVGLMTMADDSGLEIDYLNREPGIYSARFMGEHTSYEVKNAAILERLSGVAEEKRTARFVCVIACALPDGRIFTSRGVMEGIIGYESRGANGFGYDPIFYLPECGCYSAELSPEKKNELSHRGKALREMRRILQDNGLLFV